MNKKLFLLLAITLTFTSTLSVSAESGYVPGEVVVEFPNTATEQQVRAVISSHNLQWKEGSPIFVQTSAFRIYVQVPQEVIADFSKRDALSKDIVDKDKEVNTNKSILISAWPTSFTYVEKYGGTVLVILFNNTATEEKVRSLIGLFGDLKIVDLVPDNTTSATIHVWGIVKVPVGKEQAWITTLKTEPLVKSAGLNFIAEITNEDVVNSVPKKTSLPTIENVKPAIQPEESYSLATSVPVTSDTKPYAGNTRLLVILIIAGVVAIGLAIFLIVRRQRKT